ncbi:unnamed protein product [Orchesella dallaii]|uniref:Uncharacterized protein n=1 Tax=Orchesella dallaii TaxID=48710 RepID=A0ABP1RCI3_9HEXA
MSKYVGNAVERLISQQPIDSENLVVGDEPCTFVRVRDLLYSGSAGQLWIKLIDVARSLEIPSERVVSLQMRISNGTITHSDALYEILESWKAKFSRQATLHTLINVLQNNLLNDSADALRDHFKAANEIVNELSTLEYSDGENLKLLLTSKHLKFQGKVMKVGEVIRDEKLLDEIEMDKKMVEDLITGNIPCFVNNTVPEQLEYYVHRNVTSRNILKTSVLKEECKDVFLIEGIERHKLSLLVPGGQSTDVSGNQLVNLTVRFILLQHNKDFEKISKLATTVVHWIKFKNGRFELVKSSGYIKTLQNHVDGAQDPFTEDQLAYRHERVVVIADSPGMGKTCLLANIAHQIMREQPTMLVRFIVLKEFVDALNNKEINADSIVKLIAERSSEYEFGKKLVENALKTQDCVLLFDGLDEVLSDQMTTAKKILQTAGELRPAKVFVTTRPHLRDEIENELHVLAYTMNPFDESNQINFLLEFWKTKGATENDSLRKFTKDCVSQLSSNMTDSERNIAGIPLQCRMVAEIYEEQAIRCTDMKSNDAEPIIINSMFEVYVKHMNMRFEKADSNQHDTIRKVHMWLALELLFPDYSSQFKSPNRSGIPLNELCGVGIVEATDSNDIRFVHRTFAEYLVALLAHEIIIHSSHPDLLLSTIFKLSPNQVTLTTPFKEANVELESFQFNFPVICYFVNAFLKTKPSNNHPFDYHEEALPYYHASAFHNYDTIPLILSRLVQSATKTCEVLKRDVLYVAALHSGLELIKLFCSTIGITQIGFLNIHDQTSWRRELFSPFTMTPLHVAVRRGHYGIVEYLVNKFEDKLANLRYLTHFCICNSAFDAQVMVKDKIQIIKLLSNINHDWIDDRLLTQSTPLMQYQVHVQLLQCLIEERPNLDACDQDGNTVLHKVTEMNELTSESYDMILNCLIQHGFKNINKPNKYYQATPLHLAVKNVELLSRTLERFVSERADLNAVDDEGYSVLFYAIRAQRSSDLLGMLINLGSNTNYRDRRGRNALHISVETGNLKAVEYFINTHNINVNHQDVDMYTPLHLAVGELRWFTENESMQLLLMKLGANVNAVNKLSNTPFLESFQHGEGVSLTILNEMETRGLHITKALASKALTFSYKN